MKKAYFSILLFLAIFATAHAGAALDFASQDTAEVNLLNKQGFKMHLTDYDETIRKGAQALELAQRLNYINGIAEAYRVIGLGEAYGNHEGKAIANYLNALSYFKKAGDVLGQAKVYNNIGNLYLNVDYDQALEYLQKCLTIAQTLNNTKMIASVTLNMGNVYLRKKNFSLALDNYNQSQVLFTKLNDASSLIFCLQN